MPVPEGPPNAIVKPPILTPQQVAVESRGELVMIHIGNSTLTMGYEDAIQLSNWIRVRAKESKHRAGDVSRHWSVIGILQDLK